MFTLPQNGLEVPPLAKCPTHRFKYITFCVDPDGKPCQDYDDFVGYFVITTCRVLPPLPSPSPLPFSLGAAASYKPLPDNVDDADYIISSWFAATEQKTMRAEARTVMMLTSLRA